MTIVSMQDRLPRPQELKYNTIVNYWHFLGMFKDDIMIIKSKDIQCTN